MTKEEWQAEVDATVAALPQKIPDGAVEYLKSVGKLSRNALVWRVKDRRKGIAEVHCTACGHSDEMEYVGKGQGYQEPHLLDWRGQVVGSYSDVQCPVCGAFMQNKHRVQGGCEDIDSAYCVSVHNVRGHLCLLEWQVRKFVDRDGNVTYDAHQWEGVLLVGGKMVSVRGYQRFMCSLAFFTEWEARKRFVDGIEYTEVMLPFEDQTVWNTEAEKSGIEVYMRQNLTFKGIRIYPSFYLYLWSKHKNVENLVKSGLCVYVNGLLGACAHQTYYGQRWQFYVKETEGYVDWKKNKPAEMLGMAKEELAIAGVGSPEDVAFYKRIRDTECVRLTIEEMNAAHRIGTRSLSEIEWARGVKHATRKVIRYLMRQRKERGDDRANVRELEDYWRMAHEVYGRVTEPWPKDLIAMHDRVMALKKEKINRKIDEGIKAQAQAWAWASFEDDGMLIRHVGSHTEIIKEGELLHHCVGGYANSVAEGKTHIFLIRKAEEPAMPFFTLEWKNGKVVQNRGLRNCARTPEVEAFEKAWVAYMNKEEKKHETDGKTDAA